jgi:hypothetical protein
MYIRRGRSGGGGKIKKMPKGAAPSRAEDALLHPCGTNRKTVRLFPFPDGGVLFLFRSDIDEARPEDAVLMPLLK